MAEPEQPRVELSRKRVRAVRDGQVVADTLYPRLVWEHPYYPVYYLPVADVRTDQLPAEALLYGEPGGPLSDLVKLDWDTMDGWFEEDEQVYTHPRSPYTRIDILDSSRRVRVEVAGQPVADSNRPRILFETGLPPRFYLPKLDVRLDLLEPSDTVTHCPYKGQSRYWSVRVGGALHPDLAWSYPTPLPESQRIAGLVTFYDEKVDVYLDGVRQQRPDSPFS
ncbi:MAG: DUF427 domain-containing protein [Natronosporangium sp.]